MDRTHSVALFDTPRRCMHPNLFGCPNHGAQAREWLRATFSPVDRELTECLPAHDRRQLPVPFKMTEKGRLANRGVIDR